MFSDPFDLTCPVPELTIKYGRPPETRLWDLYPLDRGSWGNIAGFCDAPEGSMVDIRRLVPATCPGENGRVFANPVARYVPACAPILPGYADGGVRSCYRPTREDIEAVGALFSNLKDASAPPWFEVSARLLALGHSRETIERLTPPELLALLRNAPQVGPPEVPSAELPIMAKVAAVYAGRAAADRFSAAVAAVQAAGTVDERLTALDRAVPIPPTASAKTLADVLGCSSAAVKQTRWWREHRQGREGERQAWRFENHRQRSARLG